MLLNLTLVTLITLALLEDPPAALEDGRQREAAALVRQAQQGDREAVAALYRLHASAIYRYMIRRVPTAADAEDLTAEVFVRMVESLPAYEITRAPFEAWLYRIAAFRVADYYRRRRRVQQEVLDDTLEDVLVDEQPLPEEQFLDGQQIALLRDALHQLPDEHQTILILRFVERKTHEEVAALLNKSVPAIRNAQFRALSRLTELLGQQRKYRHYLRGRHGEL